MAVEHRSQRADAFGTAGIHLVRHRRRTDLTRPEPFGDKLVPGHESQGGRNARRGARHLHQRADHIEVEAAGVDLADGVEHSRKSQMRRDRLFQGIYGIGVTEKVELVETGTDRAFQSSKRVAVQKVF